MELLGMIFSITGAYMISKADQRSLYIAFYSFLISNLALLVFFAVNGKAPMVIQFALFFFTAALGVIRCGEMVNRKRDYILISLVVIPSYNDSTTVETIFSHSKKGASTITNDFNNFS